GAANHVQYELERQWLFGARRSIEQHPQVLATHALEREVVAEVDLADVEDFGDVRVIELARDGGLVAEHLDELFILGDRRKDALDGDQSLARAIMGAEHLCHAPDVDALGELVGAKRLRAIHGAPTRKRRATACKLANV